MTVRGICVTTSDLAGLENLGRAGCTKINPFQALAGVIFTTGDFQFDDVEEMALNANWIAGVKSGGVIPLPDLNTYEDESVDPTYNESERQKRTLTRQGDYRHIYRWNLPFDVHKKLQSFRGADVRVFLFDEAGNIYGTNTGSGIKGFSVSMINPLKMNFMAAGADTPSLSSVAVDYNDEREWNTWGVSLAPSWDISELQPLVDVSMEVVGTPSSTSVTVRVYSTPGFASDGTIAKRGIAGIVQADFTVSLTGSVSTMTDNGDGTYTFAGTSLATGTITLVPPTAAVSEFGSLIFIATAPLAVTI